MKRISFLFFLFLSYFSLCKPMEYNNEPLSIYDKLERISPEAPFNEYLQLIQTMRSQNLSVHDCITTIAKKRITAQKPLLKEEWGISDEDFKDIETIRNNIVQQDKQGTTATIMVADNFPAEYKNYFTRQCIQDITRLFNGVGYKKLVNITFAGPAVENGGIRIQPIQLNRIVGTNVYPIDIDKKKLKIEVFIATPYTVKLQPIFFEYSKTAKWGHWLRAISFPVAVGLVEESLLPFAACIKHPELLRDKIPFYTSSSFINMQEAVCAATDQIAASISRAHAKCYQKTLEQTLRIYAEIHSQSNPEAYDPKPLPWQTSLRNRLADIERIAKLKIHEEFLNRMNKKYP